MGKRLVGVAPLAAAHGNATVRRVLENALEQVVDRGMAVGGDPHALAVADEPDGDPRRRVRLPRAWRPLDPQAPAGQASGDPHCVARGSSGVGVVAQPDHRSRRKPKQEIPRRTIRARAVDAATGDALCKAPERRLLLCRSERRRGNEGPGVRGGRGLAP